MIDNVQIGVRRRGLALFVALSATWSLAGVAAAETSINLNNVRGAPGAKVVITATLAGSGGVVVATSNDIVYDGTQLSVAQNAAGKPDCTINPAIGASTAAGKTLLASAPPSQDTAKTLRVGVIGLNNANSIPDGTLFSCKFVIAAGATSGMKLLQNKTEASDASANAVAVQGGNGTITVTQPKRKTARHR